MVFVLSLFMSVALAEQKCVVMDRFSRGIVAEFNGKCSRANAPGKYSDRVNFILSQDKNSEKKDAIKQRLRAAAPGQPQAVRDLIDLVLNDPDPFEDVDDLLPVPVPEVPDLSKPAPEVPGDVKVKSRLRK